MMIAHHLDVKNNYSSLIRCSIIIIILHFINPSISFIPPLSHTTTRTKLPSTESSSNEEDNNIDSKNINGSTQKEEIIGIGGSGGITYDVNRLKRNLVQEAVRGYKLELLNWLSNPSSSSSSMRSISRVEEEDEIVTSDELIEEKLSALIQVNPVSTTTDSNLLEGKWELAFTSQRSANDLYQRNTSSSSSSSSKRSRTETPFRSRKTRTILLESLDIHENAHMIDQTGNGWLYSKRKRFKLVDLTKTRMGLVEESNDLVLLGGLIPSFKFDSLNERKKMVVNVLYLDGDLCISCDGEEGEDDDEILEGPVRVYTKSDAWVGRGARTKRKIRFFLGAFTWLSNLESPLHIRRRLSNNNNIKAKSDQIMIQTPNKLTVLRLGEITTTTTTQASSNDNNNDMVWDGDEDPFVHLTADERQEVMKKMSLKEIEEAGRLKRKENEKKEEKRKKGWYRRRKMFKKPSS